MPARRSKKHTQGYGALVDNAVARFKALYVTLHQIELTQVLALALQYDLSACDAKCLWLAAAELKAPMAAFDEKLAAAASIHLASLP